MPERLATLRDLLTQTPQVAWNGLFSLFADWPATKEREVALDYAKEHTKDWPDDHCAVRGIDTAHPCWPLVRHITLRSTDKQLESLSKAPVPSVRFTYGDSFSSPKRDDIQFCQALDFGWGTNIKSLDFLEHHPHLRDLNASNTTLFIFDKTDLRGTNWKAFTKLETLCLGPSQWPCLTPISPLSSLQTLRFEAAISLQDVRSLRHHPKLRTLSFAYSDTLETLDGCQSLHQLESLDLFDCSALKDLSALARLPSLRMLDLRECPQLTIQPKYPLMQSREEVQAYQRRLLSGPTKAQRPAPEPEGFLHAPPSELYQGKYSKWAAKLTPWTLEAILWVVRAYSLRLKEVPAQLERLYPQLDCSGLDRGKWSIVVLAAVGQEMTELPPWLPRWATEHFDTKSPAFSSEFQERLRLQEGTRWAATLSEYTMHFLIWMLGEGLVRNAHVWGPHGFEELGVSLQDALFVSECLGILSLCFWQRKIRLPEAQHQLRPLPSFAPPEEAC